VLKRLGDAMYTRQRDKHADRRSAVFIWIGSHNIDIKHTRN